MELLVACGRMIPCYRNNDVDMYDFTKIPIFVLGRFHV